MDGRTFDGISTVDEDTDPRLLTSRIELPNKLLQYELEPNFSLAKEAPKMVALATSSFYKPGKDGQWNPIVKMRANAALKMFRIATDRGYEVVCTDEFSDEGWRREARETGVLLTNSDFDTYGEGSSNMGRCRRQAVDLASKIDGIQAVSWIEPEKWPMLQSPHGIDSLAVAATPLLDGRADWIIPRRLDSGASYPAAQQWAERLGNAAAQSLMMDYAERMGKPKAVAEEFAQYLDHFFGPKMFRVEDNNVKYFMQYGKMAQGDAAFNDQWGSVHYPPFLALLDGKRVRGIGVHYVHPFQQTRAEAGDVRYDLKRFEQGDALTKTLARVLNKDLMNKGQSNLISI